MTTAGAAAELQDLQEDEAPTGRALKIPVSQRKDAYQAGLTALGEDTREWWQEHLEREPDELDEGEEPATPDVEGLRQFIETGVLPWFEARRTDLAHRPLIREQAFGEALDPGRLEQLGRYEVHLDRKLKRMLAMLLRLKDLRAIPADG